MFYSLSDNSSLNASYSEGKREPNRNDYVESSPNSRPNPETLYDTEIGYKYHSNNMAFGINLYNMDYKNQLVKTGAINDVGSSVHSNIKDSYRKGIELEAAVKLTSKLSWNGNLTISENKIVEHTEFIDNWDTWGKDETSYQNTDISFSPNQIAASQFNYVVSDKLNASIITKHVGSQYIDNTQSTERMLDAYTVNNLVFSYKLNLKKVKEARITLLVNNVLDHQYTNRAWIYRFVSEGSDPRGESNPYTQADSDGYNMTGNFPQAGRNYLLGLTLGF